MVNYYSNLELLHFSFFFPRAGVCPLLCSGHGYYGGGRCHCQDAWKGSECEIHVEECEVPDCNGHGKCKEGVCLCDKGWTGKSCDQSKSTTYVLFK